MQLNSSPAQPGTPVILGSLPDPTISDQTCPRRATIEIDLMLLAIEALELEGSEVILQTAKFLELDEIIKDRVTLWRLRNTNPLRRHNQRRALSLTEAKALVIVGCYMARRLTVLIRQLLLAYQQLQEQQLSMDHHFRLNEYLERFRAHFRSRMNPRRAAVAENYSDESLNQLALNLLTELLFCTGTYGIQRFWFSLFDGEVA
jgi:hypothetical protein